MRIILHRQDGDGAAWLRDFADLLPEAQVDLWRDDADLADAAPYDYAVLWSPPMAMLPVLRQVSAIFSTGAGVDALLKLGHALPAQIPIVRLGDAGMGLQMAEYVTHAVLRYFRRFDDYERQARAGQWAPLPAYAKADFAVGVLGLGQLGQRVLEALARFGFPLRGWSRTQKTLPGVDCYAGADGLEAFLRGSRVLVNLLPLTPGTANLLARANLAKLPPRSYLINVARGGHVAEPDLLALITSGHIAAATLDVTRHEPLPAQHPFWLEPRITLTPHISALTLRRESIAQIAGKMRALAAREPVADIVDRILGY